MELHTCKMLLKSIPAKPNLKDISSQVVNEKHLLRMRKKSQQLWNKKISKQTHNRVVTGEHKNNFKITATQRNITEFWNTTKRQVP